MLKKVYPHEKAVKMICCGECGAFNPLLIECLTDISGFLEKELQTNTSGIKNKLEIQEVTDELLNNNDLSVSGQMLQQLEFERSRAAFFEEELSGITFSYRSDPPVLSLTEKGAEQLGLSKEVSAPLDSPEVQKISDGSLDKLLEKISHASPTEPDVSMKGHIIADGKTTECEFRCRTMWMSSDDPVYIGTAGTIFFLKMMQTESSDNSVNSQLCGLAIRFDKLFIRRKEINDVQFDFVINEMKIDKGAFSAELIDLLSKCRAEILSYYKKLETSGIETV